MIILATAVILSLNSSGIIDRATKAKNDSDMATVKEYVSMLEAEWEFMSEDERKDYSSKEDYIDKKLEEKGYDMRLTKDGELVTASAKKALEEGLKIGDVVEYTVTSKTVKSEVANNGYEDQNISNQANLTWRYIGISDDGKIMIAPDMTKDAPKVTLYGRVGYLEGPNELHRICKELYSTDKGTARSMTIEDVNNLLGYTGNKGGYYNYASLAADGPDYVPTKEPLTVAELDIQYYTSYDLYTPDGKDIGTYKADSYGIEEDDVEHMLYPENRQYLYYDIDIDENFPDHYWLANRENEVFLTAGSYKESYFCVRSVHSNSCFYSVLYLGRRMF